MEHHFQVNLRGIIDLLSNHLYSGPEVFVRELLQNAVDAIHAREKLEPDFRGEILLELTRPGTGRPSLVVTENGIGLTEDEIHRFLATIGESSKRSLANERVSDFIGQFGIGLLSCFMVSDEIVVVTRSVKEGAAAMEWRGKADGTYTVKKLDIELSPGTQVYLTCKDGAEDFYERERLVELAKHYGLLLPYPIRIVSGKSSTHVNADVPPWRTKGTATRELNKSLLKFGRDAFGEKFFDAIPLHLKEGGIDGVAFILNSAPNMSAKQRHRVYLKNMFLTESAEDVLPSWAFFVKLFINTTSLKPTASREGLQNDRTLEAARDALGLALRRYLIELSEKDPDKLARLIAIHSLTIKALAAEDDEFYRIVFDWLPIETSDGEMTLGEYRTQHEVLRYAPTVDEFRQIAHVAAAQKICVINAGYVHDVRLLERFPYLFENGRIEKVEAGDMADAFTDLNDVEERQVESFLKEASAVLRPLRCHAAIKKFARGYPHALHDLGGRPLSPFGRAVARNRRSALVLSTRQRRAQGRWRRTVRATLLQLRQPSAAATHRRPQPRHPAAIGPDAVRTGALARPPPAERAGNAPVERGTAGVDRTLRGRGGGSAMIDELQALSQRIDGMERCTAKVALLEEAIRIADSRKDVDGGYEFRQKLVKEAEFTGYPEKALVAFAWTLAHYDREPERFEDIRKLLWQFKWIVGILDAFSKISRQQIEEAVADLARRSERCGSSLRHVYSLRCQIARSLGDEQEMRATLPVWEKSPRDFLSDCPACDRNQIIATHAFLKQDLRAVQLAGPIINGELFCAEVPHVTYAKLLIPLVRLNRLDEAHAYSRKGYALVKNNLKFLEEAADHLIFMVLTHDLKGAVQLVERHLNVALNTPVPRRRLAFYRACLFLFRRLEQSPQGKRVLHLPDDFPLWNKTGVYDLTQVKEWFEREARALAEQFDARNGNTFRTDELTALSELEDLIQPSDEKPENGPGTP